ncbi:cytochrome c-type biogenesis protein [uncultured Phenylobacterium sp.]|uniref:cytochrome c-type biogenesis protein n=1 Tax=uncultured Phenylobacterium sp. TaxID=349273 RepID=UPI0025DBE448|nr:cytochrome c-type biogenesis protein [uncultured Phenylobacterium sp.]
MRVRALLAALAGVLCVAAASDPAERLADPAQEARAREIFRDVRCLVCQNESIDDSEADLARDLRLIVREQVKAGRSEGEIKAFLTERYGEFVLMTPSFSASNLLLWSGPFLVVLAGAVLLFLRLRSRAPDAELTPLEAERLRALSRDEAS